MRSSLQPKMAIVLENFHRAGAQRHFFEILKGIQTFRKDIRCKLFLIGTPIPEWSTFEGEARQEGIFIVDAPYVFRRTTDNNIRARVANWLSRSMWEKKLNYCFYSQLAECDAVICGQPFVADLLLPNLQGNQRFCFHLLEHIAQRKLDSIEKILRNRRVNVIFQHQSQVQQLSRQIKVSNITWPLRISADNIHRSTSAEICPSPVFRLVHYSRISPMRFIDKIINAFSLLAKDANASLSIVGFVEDPLYYSSLLDQVNRLGISSRVIFLDEVKSIASNLASSSYDAVWMISLSGHVGYASIESMAAGIPTLLLEVDSQAHACPADPALSGLICATPDQLVKRSLALQADPKAFLQQQAQLVRDRFITTKEAIDDLTAFYLGQW